MAATLKEMWEKANAERSGFLDRVREAAAYTIPSALPYEGQDENSEQALSYQNLGADGIQNLVSKLVLALFPPGTPWYRFQTGPKVNANPNLTHEQLDAFIAWLYRRERLVLAKLDATNYRVRQRFSLEQILIAGNSLGKLTDDYRLKSFRIDQWVGKRDGSSDLLWLNVCEKIDPLTVADEVLARAEIDRQQALEKTGDERNLCLYTYAERQRNNHWVLRQELNGHQIAESEEPVSPFICAGYEEIPGEDYSRSFIESKMGDLRSFNQLRKAIIDGMAAFAKLLIGVDSSSGLQPSDLTKRNGSILGNARVTSDGRIQGVGFLTTNKVGDFSIALQTCQGIETSLGKSMLLELAMQPTGERVTATQIMRIAQELQGALGSVYSQIAEEIQRPLIERVIYQMERDKLLIPLPAELRAAGAVQIQILTGLEALSRQSDLEKLQATLQAAAQIPGALNRMRMDTVLIRLLQNYGVDTSDLLKTDEEMANEQKAAMTAQLTQAAGQQAISSLGKIAEQNAVPQQLGE